VKRLLSVGAVLSVVLGFVAGSLASDVERVALPTGEMGEMDISLGGLHPKDVCWIWMDELGAYVYANTANWFDSCCAFKKYVDPGSGFNDCVAPYYPFNVESMEIALHTFSALDTVQLVCDWDIEEAGAWDSTMGCYRPGVEIWRSEPMVISLPPDWYGWVNITFPSVWVWGPFFISWHLLNDPPAGQWGWLTDQAATTICWNWINYGCAGDPNWYEWVYDLGYPWNDGNLLFRVDGRPEWNVAVDMISFEAVPGDGMVTLNWRTESEYNNDFWNLRRDGQWIARVDGQGNTSRATDYSYVDDIDLINGITYSYTIEAVDYDGSIDIYGPVTATPLAAGAVPEKFALWQNYPNPFNASTVIRYQLASDEHVTLKVYNIYGQEVASLVDADQKASRYSVPWTGQGVSSGVYLYTLTAGDLSQTRKMVLIK
jgi:hypothetical protein